MKGGDDMKYPETAKRLSYILNLRKMKPQDLANKSGVGKSSISHYINGSHEPKNINAGAMAQVLKCDPMWLMGFDVPMIKSEEHVDIYYTDIDWFESVDKRLRVLQLHDLFSHVKELNDEGVKKLIERAIELEEVPKYRLSNEEPKAVPNAALS